MKPETIKALQENEKPFGLMSAELQSAMVGDFKKDDIEYFNGPKWLGKDKDGSFGGFAHEKTYRLRPDYKQEPSVVECEISENEFGLMMAKCKQRGNMLLSDVVDYPDFIGFKFEDGSRMPFPICYGLKSRLGYGIIADVDALAEEPVVYHATHVLFRGAGK